MLADSSENSSDSCYDIRYAWRVRFVARSRITSASMINWPELPDCGVYLFWPEEGTDWIHPDDLSIVQGWIPSTRVFRRHSYDGVYYRLQYGVDVLRVKPTLWLKVADEGFWIGDQVDGAIALTTFLDWIDISSVPLLNTAGCDFKNCGRKTRTVRCRDVGYKRQRTVLLTRGE